MFYSIIFIVCLAGVIQNFETVVYWQMLGQILNLMHLIYYHGNAVLLEFNLKPIASAFKKAQF